MAKRQTEESRIVSYFETAPLEAVRVVAGIVQGTVKRRIQESGAVIVKQPVVRKKRATRKVNAATQAEATSATPF